MPARLAGWGLLAFAGALGIVLWFGGRGGAIDGVGADSTGVAEERSAGAAQRAAGEGVEGAARYESAAGQEPPPSALTQRPQDSRTTVASAGDVRTATAAGPAADVELTWTADTALLSYSVWDWDEIDLEWWSKATTRAVSDERGLATPPPPPLELGYGSVVWLDRPGLKPRFELLPPEVTALPPQPLELDESPAVLVTVLDDRGRPVPEAVVEQHGVALASPDEAPRHAALLFRRQRTAGEDGVAAISRFPGRQAVVAQHDGQRSRPVLIQPDADRVTVRLRDTFTVSGRLPRLRGDHIDGEIIPRVTFQLRAGNLWRDLASATSREEGDYGPVTVPLEPGAGERELRALVHGIGVIPQATPLSAPKPGEAVRLHLEADVGQGQWFSGYEFDPEERLTGTTATVSWIEDGERRSVSMPARSDGYICVIGIRPGSATASVSKPGYTTAIMTSMDVPAPDPRTHALQLVKGASLTGRVLHNGAPVQDFELTYWAGEALTKRQSRTFQDRADGTFRLDDVRPGSVGIVAASPASPGSAPLQLEVPAEGLEGVEIELFDALLGQGRVIDASTGEPLEQARILPQVSAGAGAASPWGPPVPVAPDGRFHIPAFRQGGNHLQVEAPGYAPLEVFADSQGASVEFGTIEMSRSADIRVVVEDARPGIHRATLLATTPVSTTVFEPDENGRMIGWLQNVPLGKQRIGVYRPDNTDTYHELVIAEGLNEVRFEGGGGALRAQLKPAPADSILYSVGLQRTDGERWEYRVQNFEPDGSVFLDNLPAGEFILQVRDMDTTYASRRATVRDGSETNVQLSLDGADYVLRIVDGEGRPVMGAALQMRGAGPRGEVRAGTTDEDGRYRFRSLPSGDYTVHARHDVQGLAPEVALFMSDEDGEQEVVLNGSASLSIHAFDEDENLAGLSCRLLGQNGKERTDPTLTDANGQAGLPRLTPGTYVLRVESDRTWPFERAVDVRAGMGPLGVEARRLGDLEVRLINADGVPIADVALELLDEETGESVMDWIDAGWIDAPSGLRSDQRGEIHLRGLPRGTYAWTLAAQQGVLTVLPGKENLGLIATP